MSSRYFWPIASLRLVVRFSYSKPFKGWLGHPTLRLLGVPSQSKELHLELGITCIYCLPACFMGLMRHCAMLMQCKRGPLPPFF